MKKHINKAKYGIAAAAALMLAQSGQGQSADALLNKLVEKGVLTSKEADDLRKETDANFTKAYNVRSGLPTWVTSLKLSGDLRGRFEGIYAHAEDADGNDLFKDRDRLRYRARIGLVAKLLDDLEAGIRITSSDPTTEGYGGDPISGNTTFQNNGSFKFIFLDRAYGRWAPKFGDLSLALTVGKMENPFVISDLAFDPDYSPEGIAIQTGYNLNDQHSLKFNAAGFILDELSTDSDDPFLLGAQVRWDSKLTKALELTFGVSAFMIDNEEALAEPPAGTAAVPNVNRGNTRNAAGVLTANFNPIVVDAGLTFNLDSFPMYTGPFPIRVVGEYMNNLAESERNQGFAGGVSFGKSGKKGFWDVSYRYKYVAANAWYEEFEESDFSAIRPTIGPGGTLTAVALAAGTNLRGHYFRTSYSFSDAMTVGLNYILVEPITSGGVAKEEDLLTGRFQLDAMWRF
jgi:hypothetical protein